LRAVSQIGETFPLTDTANSKACLAKISDRQRKAIFENEQRSHAAVAKLTEELEAVSETGLACDRDEHTEGISAVGAAFFDRQGDLYAVSLPTPSARFRACESKLAEQWLLTKKQIESLEIAVKQR
jgi:DNA-binding IclR family transcriptional regulator